MRKILLFLFALLMSVAICSTLFACDENSGDFSELEIIVSDSDNAEGRVSIFYHIENEMEFLLSGGSVSAMVTDDSGDIVDISQNSFIAETNKIYTVTVIALALDGQHKQASYTVKGKTVPVQITFRSETGHFDDILIEVPYGGDIKNIPTVPDYEKKRDDEYTYTVIRKSWSSQDFSNLTKDKVVYASYEITKTKNEYTITFDSLGGSEVEPITFPYGTNFADPLPPPTKEGYGFLQWYVGRDFQTRISASYVFTTDVTLYAKWIKDNSEDTTPYTFKLQYNGYEITEVNGSLVTGAIILPTVYEGRAIYRVGDYAFANATALEEITLPESIIFLGRNCFSGLNALRKVTLLSEELQEIAPKSFSDCVNLTEINIPSKVTHILQSAFNGCINLQRVNFAEQSLLYYVGQKAFYDCKSLTEFHFLLKYDKDNPDVIINIFDDAFSGCITLESVYIHHSYHPALGDRVFPPGKVTAYVKPDSIDAFLPILGAVKAIVKMTE